jgi:hypothetical protein
MGHGGYDSGSRATRSKAAGWDTASAAEIFKQRKIHTQMDPEGVKERESRDSTEHPNSIPVVVALDVTGSMGSIPHNLVKEGLPHMVEQIIDAGVPDPQVLFLGIGDHECDRAPLQVGQFESSDELMDKWLTDLYIESGGGGNDGESYLLAWMFAGRFTVSDHNEKRGKKGLLFTIGDEPCLKNLPAAAQRAIMGKGQYSDATAAELLDKAREKYECYHLHISQGYNGSSKRVKDGWKQLMGDHVVYVQNHNQVAGTIAQIVSEVVSNQGDQVIQALQEAGETEFEDLPPLPSA